MSSHMEVANLSFHSLFPFFYVLLKANCLPAVIRLTKIVKHITVNNGTYNTNLTKLTYRQARTDLTNSASRKIMEVFDSNASI